MIYFYSSFYIINTQMEHNNDISGVNNIIELYENSLWRNWITLIPMSKTFPFEDYNRKNHFIHVANILLDDEVYKNGKNKGNKKRKTLIQFNPIIQSKEFNKKNEWIYLFVINNRIVKIGGTRMGLRNRAASYLCGHHIKERKKSGKCSITNAIIYNTFLFYLSNGCSIKM